MVFDVAEARTCKHRRGGNVFSITELDVQWIPRARLGAFGDARGVFTGMTLGRLVGNTGQHFEYVHDDEPHRPPDGGVGSISWSKYIACRIHT